MDRTLPEITDRVFFDISINGIKIGRISFGLFGKTAPKAVANFLSLALCDSGSGVITGKPLCYRGSTFHRIIPDFAIQGGDFTHHDGTGGESIYGGLFEDESFEVNFNRRYMLAMSNRGRDANGSQFFINTVKTQWLNGKNVAFGVVLEGHKVVDEIEKHGTYGGKPTADIAIVDCGKEPLQPDDKLPHH